MSNDNRSERRELLIVGRLLLTVGVGCLTVGAAIFASLFDGIGPVERTIGGLTFAAVMIRIGDLLSRRQNRTFAYWTANNLLAAGYALAYFFIYALHYVPGLTVVDTPYLYWVLGPALAALATWHGSRNTSMRWIAPAFTLLATGHVSHAVLTSVAVFTVFGLSIKVAAVGCFVGMLWCASLSAVYKRLGARYKWESEDSTESLLWLVNRSLHELYFIAGVLNAWALPLVVGSLAQAPLWWALEAPILLALSWKGASYFKHGVVGLMYVAAVAVLVKTALVSGATLPVLLSVPLSGLAISMAYRKLKGDVLPNLRLGGYCVYLYGAIAVALLVPYVQVGNVWDAMPFWMIEALVISGLGIKLRDRVVHDIGSYAALGSLVLFGLQFNTWTWWLVGPVVASAYGLSVAYSLISKKGGLTQSDFLPEAVFGWKWTVTAAHASRLDQLWSWVGAGTLLAGSFILRNTDEAVLWWSAESLLLVMLSVFIRSQRYRYQGYLAVALAGGKLAFVDLLGGAVGLAGGAAAFTLYRCLEFVVYGSVNVASSWLLHRQADRLALEAVSSDQPQTPPSDGNTTGGGDGK